MRDRVLKNKDFAPLSPEADAFVKLLYASRQKEELARPDDEVIAAYLEETTAVCPTRAEAFHGSRPLLPQQGHLRTRIRVCHEGIGHCISGLAPRL